MDDFTFLTLADCYGDDKLEILRKKGREAQVTDFAVLLGAYKNYIDKGLGCYWAKSFSCSDRVTTIYPDRQDDVVPKSRECSVRPVIKYSSLDDGLVSNRASDGVLEVEYGYYPQQAVDSFMQITLEGAFRRNEIFKTNNTFTVYPIRFVDGEEIFEQEILDEYIYNEERYVRMIASPWRGHTAKLSSGELCNEGDVVWINVAPVKWWIDEKKKDAN